IRRPVHGNPDHGRCPPPSARSTCRGGQHRPTSALDRGRGPVDPGPRHVRDAPALAQLRNRRPARPRTAPVGTAELILQLPPGLADRLTARCLLGPFTESESSTYVLGRLAAAGATTSLFTLEALAALHRAADGLPRRLNHLADLALLIAYAEGHPQADPRTIAIAAREFHLDTVAA